MTEANVLVTGAARGIGAEVCRQFARQGARVVALDRCEDDKRIDYPLATAEQLDAVVADCGGGATAVVADVADRGALMAAVEGLPTFDAVVCAAGVLWGGGPLWETPEEAWEAQVGVNTTGVLNTAAATVPAMLDAAEPRSGRFVAVASAAASRGLPSLGSYSATKHAVVGLVRSLAADLGDSGITANAVAPGATRTDILEASAAVYGLDTPEQFSEHHLLGRLLEPAEVASAIVWLCSPAAAAITGAVLPVDAGMTAS
ncbi:MAG: SDR family oxidoreductase [Actinomycetia bacterium]|nr:SDR family oxidoreductase [Actinomycetes bacterium]